VLNLYACLLISVARYPESNKMYHNEAASSCYKLIAMFKAREKNHRMFAQSTHKPKTLTTNPFF